MRMSSARAEQANTHSHNSVPSITFIQRGNRSREALARGHMTCSSCHPPGVCFGMLYEGWPFWMAMEYSLSAMSTAGLVPPSANHTAYAFCCFFSMFGVPIFGVACSMLADYFASLSIAKNVENSVRQSNASAQRAFLVRADHNALQGPCRAM